MRVSKASETNFVNVALFGSRTRRGLWWTVSAGETPRVPRPDRCRGRDPAVSKAGQFPGANQLRTGRRRVAGPDRWDAGRGSRRVLARGSRLDAVRDASSSRVRNACRGSATRADAAVHDGFRDASRGSATRTDDAGRRRGSRRVARPTTRTIAAVHDASRDASRGQLRGCLPRVTTRLATRLAARLATGFVV